jgi:hypothetical protein
MNSYRIVSRQLCLPVACAATLTLLSGCGSGGAVGGRWHKITDNLCGTFYPGKVEFFGDGTYAGSLPLWGGGQYSVVDSKRLKLDTTAGLGVYEFEVRGNVLTVKNDGGCEFKYVKED